MGMSRDDNVDPGRLGINVNLVEIVQHIERPTAQHDELGIRIVLCPAYIDVPSYSRSRGNPSESPDYFWSANVASMDDVVGPGEVLYRFGT